MSRLRVIGDAQTRRMLRSHAIGFAFAIDRISFSPNWSGRCDLRLDRCGNVNYARRDKCNKCGISRPSSRAPVPIHICTGTVLTPFVRAVGPRGGGKGGGKGRDDDGASPATREGGREVER